MRTGIYARISKDKNGTELGVTRQQEDCRREAERRGWEVVAVYVDNDVSATRSKVRPEYERMLRDVRAGYIEALVVWDIDRLTRTPRELEDVIDLANERHLALANVGGDIDLSTDDGRMMARIKGVLARREVEQMAKRLKRKFQERAEAGHPHGRSPYGYRRIDGRDVLHPDEAAVIRDSAARVLNGESLRSICRRLNDAGVHGPQAVEWNSTIMRQILLRASNAGLRQYRGEVIGKSTSDAVLTEAVYLQLKAHLTDPSRRSNYAGPTYKYMLSGLAICGLCGGAMRRVVGREVESVRKGTHKRQPSAYQCKTCYKVRRQQVLVDKLVTDVIVARLSQEGALGNFPNGDSKVSADARARMDEIDARLAIAADQFTDGILTGAQLKRITSRLREDRAAAESRFRASQPSQALRSLTSGDVAAAWDALPVPAQREVVSLLMKVTIMPTVVGGKFNPDDIRIEWNPLPGVEMKETAA